MNGVTAGVEPRPDGKGPEYTVTRELALDPGENTIEVVAYNGCGPSGCNLLASLPASTTIKFTGPVDNIKPTLHVLAIGINKYVDLGTPAEARFKPLILAVDDAKAIGEAFEKAGLGMYNKIIVTPAYDATKQGLEDIIGRLAGEIKPRDTFILFAAAHGASENGRFYLIPKEFQTGPDALAQQAIGQDLLQSWLARIKAKKALVLLDTCESGALVAGYRRSRTDESASEAAVGRLHEATGRPVLTAAAYDQKASTGNNAALGVGHGLFTWALLDAFHYAETSEPGIIRLNEIVAHVQKRVPEFAAKIAKPGQSARFGSRGEDFPLVNKLP